MTVNVKNNKAKYWLSFLSIGFMGGNAYVLQYIRYVFYGQMMDILQCTNAQLGFLTTADASTAMIFAIPGAYIADKFDAKKILVVCITGASLLTYLHAMFATSYVTAIIVWGLQSALLCPYWAALIKYINNLNGAGNAGNSFGMYYLINGISGAFGNAFPLWVSKYYGYRGAVFCVGTITLVSAILVTLFLDSEKDKLARGEKLVGDEPIRLGHIKFVLKWPGLYILFFAYMTSYAIYSNVSYFSPYLVDVIGIDAKTSSAISIVRSYGTMLVAPIGGYMADKVLKSTAKWYIMAFSISTVLFAIPLTFGPNSNVTLVCIYSVLPSLIIMALYAVTFSIIRELHIPNTVMGTIIGIGSSSVNIVDGFLPATFGNWIDRFGNQGYTYIFLALIAICIAGIANALWAIDHDKKCKAGLRKFNIN